MGVAISHPYLCPFNPAKGYQDILGKGIRQGKTIS